ncbi:MAG: hypothetical protein NTX86_02065 [Candidatus Dependentiae bacterium]|nr:hypothetical protein [Candidatus Dependentiae bacterium]
MKTVKRTMLTLSLIALMSPLGIPSTAYAWNPFSPSDWQNLFGIVQDAFSSFGTTVQNFGQIAIAGFEDAFYEVQNFASSIPGQLESISIQAGRYVVSEPVALVFDGLMKFVGGVIVDQNKAAPTMPIVGHEQWYSLRYNQISQIKIHNATSTTKKAFGLPVIDSLTGKNLRVSNIVADQNKGIAEQLVDGLRTFKIPVHPVNGTPWATHSLQASELDQALQGAMNENLRAFLAPLIDRIKAEQWRIDLTNQPLVYALTTIKTYLDQHPTAVVTLFLNIFDFGSMSSNFVSQFQQSGLLNYAYAQTTERPWPTMQEMVNANKRLVIFYDDASTNLKYQDNRFLLSDDFIYSSAWNFTSVDALNNNTCSEIAIRPNAAWYRKQTYTNPADDNTLFELTHQVTPGVAGSPDVARQVNTYDSIVNHATRCTYNLGSAIWPNFVSVDFYDINFEDIKRALQYIQMKKYENSQIPTTPQTTSMTQASIDWVKSPDGYNWLKGTDGQRWLKTMQGHTWFSTIDGQQWRTWLNSNTGMAQESINWIKSLDGYNWLKGTDGQAWLKTTQGQNWLNTSDGLAWRIWLNTNSGMAPESITWIRSSDGHNWLNTSDGQAWLKTVEGQNWLNMADGQQWLITTQSGQTWLDTHK